MHTHLIFFDKNSSTYNVFNIDTKHIENSFELPSVPQTSLITLVFQSGEHAVRVAGNIVHIVDLFSGKIIEHTTHEVLFQLDDGRIVQGDYLPNTHLPEIYASCLEIIHGTIWGEKIFCTYGQTKSQNMLFAGSHYLILPDIVDTKIYSMKTGDEVTVSSQSYLEFLDTRVVARGDFAITFDCDIIDLRTGYSMGKIPHVGSQCYPSFLTDDFYGLTLTIKIWKYVSVPMMKQ